MGDILKSAGLRYVAIDTNSELVLRERAKGYPVLYGDVRRPEVLRSAGAGDAELVIVMTNDFEAAEDIVASLSENHPNLAILVRGHDASQCRRLQQLGATLAVSENVETSLDLARQVLHSRSIAPGRIEALLNRYRDDYYAGLDSEPTPSR